MSVVHVSNISHSTSEKEVREFFSFCGKINHLSLTPSSDAPESPLSASVTFDKDSAAKTALLLDNTQLGQTAVHVVAGQSLDEITGGQAVAAREDEEHRHERIEQEDKPRSRIVAEYLAHGYSISDQAIQKAIELDNKHGFSSKFTTALNSFDTKYKATDKARGIDERYKLSNQAASGWQSLNHYFEKALSTPTGQKVRDFYRQTDKQVRDIHTEARRLADLKTGKATTEQEEEKPFPVDNASALDPAAPPYGTAPAPAPGQWVQQPKKKSVQYTEDTSRDFDILYPAFLFC